MSDDSASQVLARQWYVLQCMAQQEARAAVGLAQNLGLVSYLAQASVPPVNGARRIALFPGYIFVHADPDELSRISREVVPGAIHLLKSDGRPQPLLDDLIADIRRRLETFAAQGFVPNPYFQPGAAVRVTRGPFRGVDAIFLGPPTPSVRVTVQLEMLGRPLPVEVSVGSIESAHTIAEVKRPRRTRGKGRRIKLSPTREGKPTTGASPAAGGAGARGAKASSYLPEFRLAAAPGDWLNDRPCLVAADAEALAPGGFGPRLERRIRPEAQEDPGRGGRS